MQLIAWVFYSVLIITYVASAGFVLFHIFRYSLCRTNALFGASFFFVVFLLLFLINISLFSALPLKELLGNKNFGFPQSNGF